MRRRSWTDRPGADRYDLANPCSSLSHAGLLTTVGAGRQPECALECVAERELASRILPGEISFRASASSSWPYLDGHQLAASACLFAAFVCVTMTFCVSRGAERFT